MAEVFGVALAFVFFYACWKALCAAGAAVRDTYRGKVQDWDDRHPNGNYWKRRGAMWGYFFTMLKDGLPAALRGWKEGWAEGKAEGWEKWGKNQPDPEAAQEPDPKKPDPQPAPAPGPQPAPAPGPNGGPGPNGSKPRLKIVKPAPDGGGGSNGSSGAAPMPVEVNSVETLKAFANEKKNLATTLKEEAKLGKERTEQEIASTERAIAWMRSKKFVEADIAIVTALLEAEKRELSGHETLISALDSKVGAAGKTDEMAARHIGIQQQQAAGVYAGAK